MPPVLVSLLVKLAPSLLGGSMKVLERVLLAQLAKYKAALLRWIIMLALISVATLGLSIAALVIALRAG